MKPDDLDPRKQKNPFVDETGKNPFSEESEEKQLPATTGDSPYTMSGHGGGVRPYRPDDFDTMAPHRSGFILTLAICGLALAPTGFCCPVFSLGGAILCVLAIALGGADLRAMKRGAIDAAGHPSTKLGVALGVVGLVLSASLVLLNVTLTLLGLLA